MKNLTAALIKAKESFAPILKTKNNPFFKSKYADLEDVLDAITPSLCANQLCIVQPTRITDPGRTILITKLIHAESGEELSGEVLLPENSDPQKLASSLTLLRRHAIISLLALAAEVDDDGNAGSGNKQTTSQSTQPPAPTLTETRNAEVQELYTKLKLTRDDVGKIITNNFNCKVGAMTPSQYTSLKQMISTLAEVNNVK